LRGHSALLFMTLQRVWGLLADPNCLPAPHLFSLA
jgi:hypothetical protein